MANPLLLGAGIVGAGYLLLKLRKKEPFVPPVSAEAVHSANAPMLPASAAARIPRPGSNVVIPGGIDPADKQTLELMQGGGASVAAVAARRGQAAAKEKLALEAMAVRDAAMQRSLVAAATVQGIVTEAQVSFRRVAEGLPTALSSGAAWIGHFRELMETLAALSGKLGQNPRGWTGKDLQMHLQGASEALSGVTQLLGSVEATRSPRMTRYASTMSEAMRVARSAAAEARSAYRNYTGYMAEALELYGNAEQARRYRSNRDDEDGAYHAALRNAEALFESYNVAELAYHSVLSPLAGFVLSTQRFLADYRTAAFVQNPAPTAAQQISAVNIMRRYLLDDSYRDIQLQLDRASRGLPQLSAAVAALSVQTNSAGLAGLGKVKSMANLRFTMSRHVGRGEERGMERSPYGDPDDNKVRVGMGSDLADWYGPALIPVGAQVLPQSVGYYGDSGYAKPAFTRALRGVHSLGEPIMVLETMLSGGLAGLGHAGCGCGGQGVNCFCHK